MNDFDLHIIRPSDDPILAVMITVLGDDVSHYQSTAKAKQYFHARRIFSDDNPHPLPYSVIDEPFGVRKEAVVKQAKKSADRLINSDRDLRCSRLQIRNSSQLIDIKTCILTAYNQHRPWTMFQI
jgi:hypothetical protein